MTPEQKQKRASPAKDAAEKLPGRKNPRIPAGFSFRSKENTRNADLDREVPKVAVPGIRLPRDPQERREVIENAKASVSVCSGIGIGNGACRLAGCARSCRRKAERDRHSAMCR